jgi:hypothetical protein
VTVDDFPRVISIDDLRRLPCSSFWYLASPYSKYPAGTEAAFRDVSRVAAMLVRAGVPVFCPIAHSHLVAVEGGLSLTDHDIWLPADEPFMNAAHGGLAVQMPGWRDSYGVGHEIERFEQAGKPVFCLEFDHSTETVLQEADRLIHGDRNADYGHPADDFARTGRIWGAVLGLPDIPPETVGLMMCGLKMSRECHQHGRDNLTDLAGYAGTVQMVHDRGD